MASMNMVEQLVEQPPAKKPRIDKPEEQGELANSNESNWTKSKERNDEELGTSTTIVDLASSRLPLPLPLELNCEIYKCLKLSIQRKFIWGLGRGIFGIFGQKLLIKTKRLRNPKKNVWDRTRTRRVNTTTTGTGSHTHVPKLVYAKKGFLISRELSRKDKFPGTILYYFEITTFESRYVQFGLSDKSVPSGSTFFSVQNYYIASGSSCFINGNLHHFDLLSLLKWNFNKPNVHGCGLVMDPNDKAAIFFTQNGKLMGKLIPICPSVNVDYLFPSASLSYDIIEANFGDDPEGEPFEYDIENCPGLGLACI